MCGCLFDNLLKLTFPGTGCHKQIRDCCSKKVMQLFSLSPDHTANCTIVCRRCLRAFLVLTGNSCLHPSCFFINDKVENFLEEYCRRFIRLNASVYRYDLPHKILMMGFLVVGYLEEKTDGKNS